MYLKSLELKNFRNYRELRLELNPGTNIFYGDNAQGKTNILEAVYLCGTSKSHRGSRDREIIQFQEEESHIRMYVCRNGMDYRIDIHLKKNKPKGIAINGVPIKRASELFGIVNIVFFSPEDLQIIKNGPAERRKFIDMELCQLNKYYLTQLTSYQKILIQRNKLLKDISFSPELKDTLEIWDEQMVQYGNNLIQERRKFISRLNELIAGIHKNLTGGRENIELVYDPDVEEQEFASRLEKNREKDIKYRQTSIGPHRDDLGVMVNGIDIRKYGSQGQQRTAALSLKLSEIYLVKMMIKEPPVLLLDDVLSELDSNRQNYLLQSINDIQTLITCTGLDEFINSCFPVDRLFQVVEGSVMKQN